MITMNYKYPTELVLDFISALENADMSRMRTYFATEGMVGNATVRESFLNQFFKFFNQERDWQKKINELNDSPFTDGTTYKDLLKSTLAGGENHIELYDHGGKVNGVDDFKIASVNYKHNGSIGCNFKMGIVKLNGYWYVTLPS